MFEWITGVMAAGGYLAVAGLMLLENIFPPIPSEVVMPLAGFLAATGELSFLGVLVAGTVGSVAGATFWYWIGLKLGEDRLRRFTERHGRWLTISPEEVDRASDWFRRHGAWAILIGRILPGLRTLISVPAGVARMPLLPFLFYTTLGSVVWIAGLTVLGYLLEAQYERVAGWLDPVSWVVVGTLVAVYVWRLVRQARE
ncbi:DedA family protein [uncultured Jannaschia sp.]|uniref:DedA family protein n=1 Tax=uncultured Jannaschia sp. TaxID=293347 RepID=UPI00262748F5|nr:DedA family protein [uncultured Jannaschia sp.]